jgi:hypothetical protein
LESRANLIASSKNSSRLCTETLRNKKTKRKQSKKGKTPNEVKASILSFGSFWSNFDFRYKNPPIFFNIIIF